MGDNATSLSHDRRMQLSSTLTWLVDAASASPGADRFLAELGTRLIADNVPLAGGALTLAVPHPIIARRTWLWRAGNGEVIEAVGFAPAGFGGAGGSSGDAERSWLAGLAGGAVHEDAVGAEDRGWRRSHGASPPGHGCLRRNQILVSRRSRPSQVDQSAKKKYRVCFAGGLNPAPNGELDGACGAASGATA